MKKYTSTLFKQYLFYFQTNDFNALRNDEITLDVISEFYKYSTTKDNAERTKTTLVEEETNWIQDDLRQTIWIIERSEIMINNPPQFSSIQPHNYSNNRLARWINTFAVDCPPKIRSLLHFEYLSEMVDEVSIVQLNKLLAQEWNQVRLSIDSLSLWFKSNDTDLKYEILNKKLEKQSRVLGRFNFVDAFFNQYHHNLQPYFSDTFSKIELFITIYLTQQPDDAKKLLQDTKKQYAKKIYLLKNQGKKQHNLMLSEAIIKKLDRHAKKIRLTRSEIVESLIYLYLDGKTPTKLQSLSLPQQRDIPAINPATEQKPDPNRNTSEQTNTEFEIEGGWPGD